MIEELIIKQMNKTFQVIADDAKFTKDMLASGTTQLGKANYG
jgi:hypothetical protein